MSWDVEQHLFKCAHKLLAELRLDSECTHGHRLGGQGEGERWRSREKMRTAVGEERGGKRRKRKKEEEKGGEGNETLEKRGGEIQIKCEKRSRRATCTHPQASARRGAERTFSNAALSRSCPSAGIAARVGAVKSGARGPTITGAIFALPNPPLLLSAAAAAPPPPAADAIVKQRRRPAACAWVMGASPPVAYRPGVEREEKFLLTTATMRALVIPSRSGEA